MKDSRNVFVLHNLLRAYYGGACCGSHISVHLDKQSGSVSFKDWSYGRVDNFVSFKATATKRTVDELKAFALAQRLSPSYTEQGFRDALHTFLLG